MLRQIREDPLFCAPHNCAVQTHKYADCCSPTQSQIVEDEREAGISITEGSVSDGPNRIPYSV